MNRVAVVGAGTMGNGIAHVFAQYGWGVRLIDVSAEALESGLATIRRNLARQVKKGTLTEAAAAGSVARIETARSLDAAVGGGVELVVEAASERPDLKFQIFRDLAAACGEDTILASNTSSISITAIAGHTTCPDRVIGMHFMNPVPVMKLVEVIRGHHTSDATMDRVMTIITALDKTPVEVNDYPGFVANRVVLPMINEAVYCVMEGVATPEAVDTVMKLGLAHPMGPLALADLIGLDVCLSILTVLHQELGDDKYRPCPLLRRMVAAGDLGRKTGRGFYSYG
ncbi:MAG: 3-hydroxybutyryl-CoA dehydrogenase [Gemmatimonadetes bacterium]|nr:3-hydroxybutyryl-CoA dehydrogenase [Gemmatimonadota bacterium]